MLKKGGPLKFAIMAANANMYLIHQWIAEIIYVAMFCQTV